MIRKRREQPVKRPFLIAAAVIFGITLYACASDSVNRAAYEAIYQKECLDRTGQQNCDPEHPTYDEYQRDREQAAQP
jgi:hypothetical protein